MGKKSQLEILRKSARAYGISALFFLIVVGIMGLLLCFGPLPEKGMPYYVLGALTASCFLLGLMAGAALKKRGLIYGAGYAAVFVLAVILILFAVLGAQNPIALLNIRYLLCLVFGGIGGILGVNQKN
ncbi:TIGR04086 family membrane protein [Bacilliculturomica massiliensis]|uniref:TIGR04086 family membrane protein n=1 Tax=Bacilliculturomica massiliensis TaxID=1917867 RepID=UPI001031FA82|nr:TIGR04086 family membrane protein [Bacilliculturomica massiliensis]